MIKNLKIDCVLEKLDEYRDTDVEAWSQLSGLVQDYGYLGALEYLSPIRKGPFRDIFLVEKHRKILADIENIGFILVRH